MTPSIRSFAIANATESFGLLDLYKITVRNIMETRSAPPASQGDRFIFSRTAWLWKTKSVPFLALSFGGRGRGDILELDRELVLAMFQTASLGRCAADSYAKIFRESEVVFLDET